MSILLFSLKYSRFLEHQIINTKNISQSQVILNSLQPGSSWEIDSYTCGRTLSNVYGPALPGEATGLK